MSAEHLLPSRTQQERGTRRTRLLLAAASLLLPAAAVFATGLAWRSDLPEQPAFHWDLHGRPDGGFPSDPLYWMSQVGTAALLVIGTLTLLIPTRDHSDTRKAVTILGTVSAFAAAAWLVPAGATFSAGSAGQASLGAWVVLFIVALPYGLIPRALLGKTDGG